MYPLAAALFGALPACGTPGRNVPVEVPEVIAPTPRQEVAREIGRLLRQEEDVSSEAERRLLVLDEGGRRALAAIAGETPEERDPRWLHVLDEHGILPALTPDERLEFLLWKAARSDPLYAAKAQSALVDLARGDPSRLIARLGKLSAQPASERTSRDAASLGTALAVARVERAVPALVDAYLAARDVAERRAVAEALAILAGESRRPRVTGTPQDFARDAERIRTWWATRGGGGDG
jgi:hypothetical protein